MKTLKTKTLSAMVVASAFFSPAAFAAPTVNLSGQGWVTYGDANSFALNTGGLEVSAAVGQTAIFVKLGQNTQLGNGITDMDDAFDTPTANTVDGFRMTSANEPGGAVSLASWDRLNSWDATLFSISSVLDLATNSMVFFFANNETGSTPDLAGWARVELTKVSTGASLGTFDLTNDPTHQGLVGYGPPPVGGGVPLGDPTAYTSNGAAPVVSDFIDSGNDICTDINNDFVSCLDTANVVHTFHENLGGDRAAYAIVFPELDAVIQGLLLSGADLNDYALHVDYRLGCGPELTADGQSSFPTQDGPGKTIVCNENYALNGGDEKVFIGTQLATTQIPEPSSVVLAGLGLLGLGMRRLRNQT